MLVRRGVPAVGSPPLSTRGRLSIQSTRPQQHRIREVRQKCPILLAQTPLHKKKHSRQGLGRIVRLHEVQGAAGLEPVDLLGVERVVDLDVERRSSPRGLDLQG